MATVDKNFRIKNGLVVEGSSATVNGENILREGSSDSYIINLIGGTATSENTAGTVVKRDLNGSFAAGTITADLVGNVTGTVSSLSNHDTGDLAEGVSNLYFTEQRALDATAAAYDAAGSAATAQANAESYAINAIENAAGAYIDWDPTVNQLNVNTIDISQALSQTFDEYGAAATAEANANSYTDSAISNGLAVNGNIFNAIQTAKGEATAYTDTAVANLVDGAPALLDTLNELAAAIADNPNYATDVANLVATKADTSYVDSEISDLDTAAQGYASSAQSAAESYADGLAVNYDAAGAAAQAEANANGYTDGVASDILDGTSTFAEVNINNVSKEFAATTGNIATAAQTTAYQFNKNAFRSAKFLVKIKNGTHTEVSEVLLTLDTADNVYLTEYGMSSTSGTSLGTITADTDATHVRIRVTPANNNSEVMVAGTLLI
jgi:hypothetical protein